jgi:hypothetical protein
MEKLRFPTLPAMHRICLHPLLLVPLTALLVGCELLGQDDPAKLAAAKEADGKAIGGACRHSGRALEDCFVMNPKAIKSAVFAGWRDMDAYMRENKIEVVLPTAGPSFPAGKGDKSEADAAETPKPSGDSEKKSAKKH